MTRPVVNIICNYHATAIAIYSGTEGVATDILNINQFLYKIGLLLLKNIYFDIGLNRTFLGKFPRMSKQ